MVALVTFGDVRANTIIKLLTGLKTKSHSRVNYSSERVGEISWHASKVKAQIKIPGCSMEEYPIFDLHLRSFRAFKPSPRTLEGCLTCSTHVENNLPIRHPHHQWNNLHSTKVYRICSTEEDIIRDHLISRETLLSTNWTCAVFGFMFHLHALLQLERHNLKMHNHPRPSQALPEWSSAKNLVSWESNFNNFF